MKLNFLFIYYYLNNIIFFDFLYKLFLPVYLMMYNTVRFKFSDFGKYNVYIFSRFFRNLRLNFQYFIPHTYKLVFKYMKKRKIVSLLTMNFLQLSSYNFYIIFEYLLLNTFRLFNKYQLGFLGLSMKNKKILQLSWNDIYSNLKDLNDMIIYRDNFLFKYDIPRVVYNLIFHLTEFENFDYYYIFLSFFGFDFFFRKRLFKFKFYSRVI